VKLYPCRIIGSDNGKSKTIGTPPGSESAPISVDSALNATVLDVKQQLVAQLHLDTTTFLSLLHLTIFG
jgi:hypothetical protein